VGGKKRLESNRNDVLQPQSWAFSHAWPSRNVFAIAPVLGRKPSTDLVQKEFPAVSFVHTDKNTDPKNATFAQGSLIGPVALCISGTFCSAVNLLGQTKQAPWNITIKELGGANADLLGNDNRRFCP